MECVKLGGDALLLLINPIDRVFFGLGSRKRSAQGPARDVAGGGAGITWAAESDLRIGAPQGRGGSFSSASVVVACGRIHTNDYM